MTLYDALQLAFKSDPTTQAALVNRLAAGRNDAIIAMFRESLKSYTTMYVVDEDGGLVSHSTFDNAWGSAMLIWEYFTIKYFPDVPVNNALHDHEHLKRVWALADDGRLSECERLVLLTTLDNAMSRREFLPTLAAHFFEFSDLIKPMFPATRVNSLPDQARTMIAIHNSPNAWQAIAWEQTNWRPPDQPPMWSDNYNINTGDKHWFIEDDPEEDDAKVVA